MKPNEPRYSTNLYSLKDWRNKANPIKQVYAKSMRLNPTLPETLLWERICKKQLGVKFRRQVIIRGYIVDFYCVLKRLAIEVDGKQHNPEYDKFRDQVMYDAGVGVLRFPVQRIFNDLDTVIKEIKIAILPKAECLKIDETCL